MEKENNFFDNELEINRRYRLHNKLGEYKEDDTKKQKCSCPEGYHDMFVECRGY